MSKDKPASGCTGQSDCSVFFRYYPGPYDARCQMPGFSMDETIYASNGACVACGVVNGEGLQAVLNKAWESYVQNAESEALT